MHYPAAHLTGFVLWSSLVASQFHLAFSDYVVIIGAVAFAAATVRSGRLKVLRETNQDYRERNAQLELEKKQLEQTLLFAQQRITALEAQPNLDTHEQLLQKLLDRLETHDNNMVAAAARNAGIFREIEQNLREIHTHTVRSGR